MATYYISSTGSDTNDGLSELTPFATFGPISTYHIQPSGSTILYKRGDVFSFPDDQEKATILIGNDNIIVDTYGTGNKPILTCYKDITGTWTNLSGNTWTIPLIRTTNYGMKRLWIDDVENNRAPDLNSLNSGYTWYHNYTSVDTGNTTLYLYSLTDPNILDIKTLSDSAPYALWIYQDAKNIRVSNLEFRGYSGTVVRIATASGVTIENCVIGYNCGASGLGMNTYLGYHNYDVIIRNNIFDTNCLNNANWEIKQTEDGISMQDCINIEVYNNTFKNWCHTGFGIWAYHTYDKIDGLKLYNNNFSAPNISYGRGIGGDVAYPDNNGTVEIYNNIIDNLPVSCQWNIPHSFIHNNIFSNTRGIWWRPTGFAGTALSISGYSTPAVTGMTIVNNVFANNAGSGIFISGGGGSYGDIQGNLIANNIFYNNVGRYNYDASIYTYAQLYTTDDVDILGNIFENNLFFYTGKTDLIYYGHDPNNEYYKTVSEFNELNGNSGDTIMNNINNDPLFISNFRLNINSPAIDAGIDVGLPYNGDAPDIGAFEKKPIFLKINNKIIKNDDKIISG